MALDMKSAFWNVNGQFKVMLPDERAELIAMLREVYCLACGSEQPKRGTCQCENDE